MAPKDADTFPVDPSSNVHLPSLDLLSEFSWERWSRLELLTALHKRAPLLMKLITGYPSHPLAVRGCLEATRLNDFFAHRMDIPLVTLIPSDFAAFHYERAMAAQMCRDVHLKKQQPSQFDMTGKRDVVMLGLEFTHLA